MIEAEIRSQPEGGELAFEVRFPGFQDGGFFVYRFDKARRIRREKFLGNRGEVFLYGGNLFFKAPDLFGAVLLLVQSDDFLGDL